jgi:signal transduction histidine kinase
VTLKLHTKTTLLVSVMTLAVVGVALALVSLRVADRVREEQKALAELQAVNLAEHISRLPAPRDPAELARVATLVQGARPDAVNVRVWERAGGVFVEVASSAADAQPEKLSEETKAALRSGLASKTVEARPDGSDDSLYRVFAPITETDGRLSGAVEVSERLDDALSIAWRYERGAIWLALIGVALITLGVALLYQRFVYRPLARLLRAVSRVKAGDLTAGAGVASRDEIGALAREFDEMLERLRAMTAEREAQQTVLAERVRAATAQLAERNDELREANLEIWRTARRLTELERLAAAGQTAAQFAHEVGTPLNLISGHVQLLLAASPTDEQAARARLATISAQIERIERIVRGMLDRTRPDGHALWQPLDMNALLRRTLDATLPTLDARGVRLNADLAPDLPHVNGDADRLQQVFINLINNALDAMPDGGELRVRASAQQATNGGAGGPSSQVVIELEDTGTGMTDEVRARIFDPLYTTKARGRGTGLGLVVVKQAMNDHEGEIEVESAPGRGARFRLSFPVAPSAGATGATTAVVERTA